MYIWQNEHFFIEQEPHELPWFKIFTHHPYKELTDIPLQQRNELWQLYSIVEEEMRSFFKPDKMNMASFANMLPRVHIHAIARYEDDSWFPNPVWAERLREAKRGPFEFDAFTQRLSNRLKGFT